MRKRIRVNSRIHKARHQKYRLYKRDIWGLLARKGKNDFITNLVFYYSFEMLKRKQRHLDPSTRRAVYKKIYQIEPKYITNKPSYRTDIVSVKRKPQNASDRGAMLKARRCISLYYGAGRIRQKTFRRYGKVFGYKQHSSGHMYRSSYDPVYSRLSIENRLDVLLIRSNLLPTIFIARQAIYHRKCIVEGYPAAKHPGIPVPNFRYFKLCGRYSTIYKKIILQSIASKLEFIIGIPSYLLVNFTLMKAMKIADPDLNKISFPFSESTGGANSFRKAFSLLL